MMIRHVIFLVCRDDDPVEARRIARIADRLNETGVTVKHCEEEKLPCINVGTIGHFDHGRVTLNKAIEQVLTMKYLGVPVIGHYTPKKMDTGLFAKIRKEHTRHSRHEIMRLSLNPRVMKKQRGRRFR